jgi:hypothetical protein
MFMAFSEADIASRFGRSRRVGGLQVERAGTDRAGRPRDEDQDGGSWPGLRTIVGSLPARAQRSATNGTFDDIPGGSGCREA